MLINNINNNGALVLAVFQSLQTSLCHTLIQHEPAVSFREDAWTRENIGYGRTHVLQEGEVFEKAGVNFSHIKGNTLPSVATEKYPDFIGAAFEAMGVSVVIHPRNPFLATTHMNIRYFEATNAAGTHIWWFGGGYDLTPYYVFEEDCVHWHRVAKKACDTAHPDYYAMFKKNADTYFYLKHRQEARGIGGIFFDDLNQLGFEKSFDFAQVVGNSFLDAYVPIIEERKSMPYTQAQRDFQSYRRGRYVEFNLVQDRGTLFGLRFGGRVESILMSLPPIVHWPYDYQAAAGSPEAALLDYLKPRAWV